MTNFVPPADLTKSLVGVGVKKAGIPVMKMIVLGILAGIYIGFAAHLATTVATGSTEWFGMKKFMVGSVFSVGLMLVMIPGSELFTGNCLLTVALADKKITVGSMMKNWIVVWGANLVGSILLAWMIASMTGLCSGAVGTTAINIAGGKCSLSCTEMLFRGIAANWLVCLAVMMALAAKDIAGKVLAIFFPIMTFVASGFEHSIANMYFIPAGMFAKAFPKAVEKANETKLAALTMENCIKNITVVTLGNIIGGAIFVGLVYWYLYVKGTKEEA